MTHLNVVGSDRLKRRDRFYLLELHRLNGLYAQARPELEVALRNDDVELASAASRRLFSIGALMFEATRKHSG